MRIAAIIFGGTAVLISSVWVGAMGQEIFHGGYYEEPAFFTSCVTSIYGLAIIVYGIVLIAQKFEP